jgi:peptide/nickel transport system substrate-binding protein
MKKGLIALAIALCLVLTVAAQAKPGPIVDKVILDVRMDQTIATKDTVEGKTDVFFTEVPPAIFRQLSDADKAKLDVYPVPSLSWSLKLNPVPNKAPYTWTTKDGKTFFNPFAIREIRYALNWLFDRKKLVDEVLFGAGEPMLTMATPGQPGTYKYNLVASKLGMTARGNEKKALADIEAAMQAAAKLPENAGKLVKTGQWWTYNGEPVTLNIVMRVDDPTGALLEGRYVSDQLEKAGLKVNRLEYDRSKAIKVTNGNPADLEWHMYTERWGAGATRAYWANIVAQMYAPYSGNMPGGANSANWNYEYKEIDDIVQPINNNEFLTEKEYWDGLLKALEMGLKDSVRVYMASTMTYYVANKARFNGRFAYGLGDGVNEWSIRTADVKPNANGEKILRVTQFSARGSLFMFAWDPVGTDGFSDGYVAPIRGAIVDNSTFEAPNTALTTKLRAVFDEKKLVTKVVAGKEGKPEGLVDVPETAVLFDSATKTWKPVGKGVKAMTTGTAGYLFGKWHTGQPESFADIVYATAFAVEWATKDGEGDKYYDEPLSASILDAIKLTKGIVFDVKNKTGTAWVNAQFPMEPARAFPTISPLAANPGYNTIVPWEIYEALGQLVAVGSKSGTVYTFSYSEDEAITEVDLKEPKCVADIKAKLEELVAAKFVPASIKGYITADEAVARYKAAIAFIDKYGHAFISNGPFFISKIDTTANYVELTAWRDGYPYKSDYWAKALRMTLSSIDAVKVPALADRKKDAVIEITASSYNYPDVAKTPLAKAKITVSLQLPDGGEKVYAAKADKPGTFKATIPAKDLGALKAGSYTIVVQSQIGNESPAVSPETLVLM